MKDTELKFQKIVAVYGADLAFCLSDLSKTADSSIGFLRTVKGSSQKDRVRNGTV